MRYVLLSWNPGPDNDQEYTPEEWLDQMVIPLQEGRVPEGDRWSLGTNWKTIAVGDQVCQFRQGAHGRGIVATGVVTKNPFKAKHWQSDRSGEAWFVNVAWNRALDLNRMITVDELTRAVPEFAWNHVYGSGRIVDGSAAERLAGVLGQSPLPDERSPGGQQFGSAEHNRLVELESMAIVCAGYRAKGHEILDVSSQKLGWDLEARRGKEVLYIEVKGVTGPSPEFFLTPNEHRAAAEQKNWVAVVVTGVFSAKHGWFELSGDDVTAAATPTQFRVKAHPV